MARLRTVIGGVGWTSLSSGVVAVVGIAKIVILSRLLDRTDFGLAAIAISVAGIGHYLANFGISTALVHRQTMTDREYSSIYLFSLFVAVLVYGAIWLGAPWLAHYYGSEELSSVIRWSGLTLPLSAIGAQHRTLLNKELRFRFTEIVEMAASMVGLLVSIVLALRGYGVFAMVYSLLTYAGLCALGYAAKGMLERRYALRFRWVEVKPLLRIGGYQAAAELLDHLTSESDVIIIGKLLGLEVLGAYSLMKQLATRPRTLLLPVIYKVSLPLFAQEQQDKTTLATTYLRTARLVAVILIPLFAVAALVAPTLIELFYGSSYRAYAPIFAILCFQVLFSSVVRLVNALTGAAGRTDLSFLWTVIVVVLFPAAVYLGATAGLTQAAWAMTGVSFLLVGLKFFVQIKPVLPISFGKYLAQFGYGLLWALPLTAIGAALYVGLQRSLPAFLLSVSAVSIGYLYLVYRYGATVDAGLYHLLSRFVPVSWLKKKTD